MSAFPTYCPGHPRCRSITPPQEADDEHTGEFCDRAVEGGADGRNAGKRITRTTVLGRCGYRGLARLVCGEPRASGETVRAGKAGNGPAIGKMKPMCTS